MSQLGFTFYPKDWWTSDTFYALNPFERYIYLELLFMMYSNDGRVSNDRVNVERRLGTTIKDEVWVRITERLIIDDDYLTHVSVNKRIRKTLANRKNGEKGGRPKKPKEPKKETQINPRFEIEVKREEEIESEVKAPPPVVFGSDSITSIENLAKEALEDQVNFVEHIYRQFRIDPQLLPVVLDAFNKHLKSAGELMKRKKDYRIHFQNWVRKQSFGNSPSKPKMRQG